MITSFFDIYVGKKYKKLEMLLSCKMRLSYIPPKNKLNTLYNFYFKISIPYLFYMIFYF